jgi:pyruvate dehydrogenase E1 component alpha subunit
MFFKTYDPLKGKMFQIIDETGKVTNKEFLPNLDKNELLKMYRVMSLGRIADIKSLQYQRQGRMLTFPPSRGQEACQVGPMAASSDKDWLVTAFRELGAMLYKGVTIEQTYLYWYGNEMGSHFNEGVKVLPINVPIGSQIGHAAGLAYASKIKNKGEVSIAYIGDGGTSHGEFHEGLNFAAVYDAPMIVVIQNNQYAISTPRKKQTKSTTLAQKAISYGIPGVQVDGNDVLAMYVATTYALERARKGEGPTLIEAVTYRLGPHTTSDDPTIYRSDEEVKVWEKRDPMIRFKQYLLDNKFLTEAEDQKIQEEVENEAVEAFKKVENSGLVPLEDIFQYTYENMTPQLIEQYEEYKKYLESEEN